MAISELSNKVVQPTALTDAEVIVSYLQTAQGTDHGFIDLLKRINLNELDLEGLKRSDLSGAGFSFESVHEDLVSVYNMLREILTAPRESLLDISSMVRQNLNSYLPQFYENVRNIEKFRIRNENPRETHDNLLRNISSFCGSVKAPLGHIIAYLSSRKMGEIGTEVDATVAAAVDRLDAVINRTAENNDEAAQRQEQMQQDFKSV